MKEMQYKLVDAVGTFDEEDVAEVTAQYGEWHMYDVCLTSKTSETIGSVELTEEKLAAVAEPIPPDA